MFTIFSLILVAIVFIIWILHQLIGKKKKLAEIKQDVLGVIFFIGIWVFIWYWLLY